MAKTIKIGGVDVQLPDDSPLDGDIRRSDEGSPSPWHADKPERPEKIEDHPHVYRPNDAFQSNIDQITALGNVQKTVKTWVRKTFLFILIFPASLLVITAFVSLSTQPEGEKLGQFLGLMGAAALSALPYLLIWFGTRKREDAPTRRR